MEFLPIFFFSNENTFFINLIFFPADIKPHNNLAVIFFIHGGIHFLYTFIKN